MFPEAGGIYVYLRESYGRLTAFLFGWCEFLFSKPASIGALAVADEEPERAGKVLRHAESGALIGVLGAFLRFVKWIQFDDDNTGLPITIAFGGKVGAATASSHGWEKAAGMVVLFVLVTAAMVAINQAVRKIPIQYAQRMVGKKMGMDPAAVKKEWIASIVPGIQVVPAGVLAVNRAQEHGCTYCFAYFFKSNNPSIERVVLKAVDADKLALAIKGKPQTKMHRKFHEHFL